MNPPENAPMADTALIECTYGERVHPRDDLLAPLVKSPWWQHAAA